MNSLKEHKSIAFTDDILILTKGKNVIEAETYANEDMRKIEHWAEHNKLQFNENKSKVMVITKKK